MELYKFYESEISDIKKLDKDNQAIKEVIQSYEQKRNENEMVLREIALVDEEDTIYKLVGPILVKTEIDEAKMNLEKRVGFIKDEM